MSEKKLSNAVGEQAGKTGNIAAGVARNLFTSRGRKKIKILLIFGFLLLLITTLTTVTSQSQMDDTFLLSSQGNENRRPSEEEIEKSLWDRDAAAEDTINLLEIIAEKKAEDKERQIEKIKDFCESHGYDVSRSLDSLIEDYEVVSIEKTSKDGNNQIQAFPLDAFSKKDRSPVRYRTANLESVVSKPIYESGGLKVEHGIYYYNNGDYSNICVSMSPYFGSIGSRYRINFADGSTMVVIKAEEFTPAETDGGSGPIHSGGGIMEILTDGNHSGARMISSRLDETYVTEVVMLESQFVSTDTTDLSTADGRVLAAFSVSLDNAQLIKGEGPFKKSFLQHVGDKYTNQRGDVFKAAWFGKYAGEINYEKSLKEKLKIFLKDNSFYRIDYERTASGAIKTIPFTVVTYVENEETGELEAEYDTEYYVVPYLIELDINTLAEKLFDVDPEAPYVNSGSTYEKDETGNVINTNTITNRAAINNIAQGTNALLYNVYFSSNEINISELSGEYAWPVPGCYTITSPFGKRIHPVTQKISYHEGIDIACTTGTAVYAASDGVVEFSGNNGNYGIMITISHENGMRTTYAHLSMAGVRKGASVKKGQIIAYSGNTGRSTGPHLHFEVRGTGGPTNPIPYITTPESYGNLINAY